MLQYKAGYKFVDAQVHAQVLDFPAAITCADSLVEARRLLADALLEVAEVCLDSGSPLPRPNPLAVNLEMDIEEPIYLHLQVSSDVHPVASGVVAP